MVSLLLTLLQLNDRPYLAPLDVYDDSKVVSTSHLELDASKTHLNSWTILGSRRERNKENNALPSKWTSHKVRCHHDTVLLLLLLDSILFKFI